VDLDKTKLIKLLNLTSSNSDGEALNALRIANKMLTENNITWQQIVTGDYKTPETAREYAKGYRAGFAKATNQAYKRPVVVMRQQRPTQTMIFDHHRLQETLNRIMSHWDNLNVHQKHYVNNAVEFIKANRCLPLSNYDELMKISKSLWGQY